MYPVSYMSPPLPRALTVKLNQVYSTGSIHSPLTLVSYPVGDEGWGVRGEGWGVRGAEARRQTDISCLSHVLSLTHNTYKRGMHRYGYVYKKQIANWNNFTKHQRLSQFKQLSKHCSEFRLLPSCSSFFSPSTVPQLEILPRPIVEDPLFIN